MMSMIIKLIALMSISGVLTKGQITISWTVDDYGEIYMDGVKGEHSGKWEHSLQVSVPAFTKVIGFYCRDYGVIAGLLASYSNGWSTTDRQYWRCTSTYENNWMDPDFDDSGWEVPVFTGTNGDSPWNRVVTGISSTAKWLWTKNRARIIYCRHNIYKQSPEFSFPKGEITISWTVDNEGIIYVDGVNKGQSNTWENVLKATVPASTKVIGFYCKDYGVVAGLIASYSNGWSTTDRQYWRCTSKYENNWMNPDFDDSGWEVPVIKGSYLEYPWNRVLPGIASTAKWIWTSNRARVIYCRHNIYKQNH